MKFWKFKSFKSRLKEMKEPILQELERERKWQLDLRMSIMNAKDDLIKDEAKVLFDDSVEYCKVLTKSLEEYDKLSADKWKISPDTLLTVAANLVGIMLVLNFEKLDIVRSKAFSMIIKGRI